MQLIILSIHLVVCIALIGLVLLQRSEGGALGMGGGGAGALMSGRGAADALAKMTLSDDKSVSLFCFPFAKKDQKESIVAHHATRPVYSELAIVKTGWDGVALKAMPNVEPPEPISYHHHEREGSNPEYTTSGALLPVLLDQLQRQGVLEDLGRKGLDVLRRVLANLAQGAAVGRQGFDAESLKESGFAKESGFVAEMLDKESGFAAKVLGPTVRPQPARRPEPAVTNAARTRKKRKR